MSCAAADPVLELYEKYKALLKAQDEKDYEKSYADWYAFYEAKGSFAPGRPIYPSFSSITYTDPMFFEEWKKLSNAERVAKIAEVSE